MNATGEAILPRGATRMGERKLAPDLARGFMLLLIAMAYAPMYLPHADVGGYGLRPGGGAIDEAVSFLAALFLENRAFPMFAILFGYGMVMLVGRQEAAGASEGQTRGLLRRRALWLIVFGLVHAILVYPGEILAAYGLGTLMLGWLLFRPERTVVRAIAVLAPFTIVMAVLISLVILSGGTESSVVPGYRTVEDWMVRIVGAPLGPLFSALGYPLLILVAIGMLLGKKGMLEDPERHRGPLVRLTVAGIGVSVLGGLPLALAGAGAIVVDDTGFALLSALQIVTGVAGGVGYVAGFGLIGISVEKRGRASIFTRALVAAGRRSLTVYLMVSVGVAVTLHPDLLAVGEHVHRAGAMGVAFLVWATSVGVALLLDMAGKRGPADALLRRLAYGSAR